MLNIQPGGFVVALVTAFPRHIHQASRSNLFPSPRPLKSESPDKPLPSHQLMRAGPAGRPPLCSEARIKNGFRLFRATRATPLRAPSSWLAGEIGIRKIELQLCSRWAGRTCLQRDIGDGEWLYQEAGALSRLGIGSVRGLMRLSSLIGELIQDDEFGLIRGM